MGIRKQLEFSKRKLNRIPVRKEESFIVRFHYLSVNFEGELNDFTSSGALLSIKKTNQQVFFIGHKIENIKIFVKTLLAGSLPEGSICHIAENDNLLLIGIRFHHQQTTENSQPVRGLRRHGRFWIQNQFLPKAEVRNPIYLNDIIVFDVLNISKTGLKMSTSMRNKSLLQGQILNNIIVYLPLVGTIAIDCKIQYLEDNKTNRMGCGLMFLKLSPEDDDKLTRYLIGFAIYEREQLIDDLKENSQTTKSLKKFVQFGIVETEADYLSVLQLRHNAYTRAGKIAKGIDPMTMADKYDHHSRIIYGRYRGRIVASMRLTYCTSISHSFELEESLILPTKFKRGSIVEASRACVSEDFENSDLIHGLFEFSAGLSIKFGVDWVISSCDEKLYPLYQKLGFKRQGITFQLKTLSNTPHLLIAARTEVISTSKGLNPAIWFFSYRHLAEHLANLGFVRTNQLSILQILVMKLGLCLLRTKKLISTLRKIS